MGRLLKPEIFSLDRGRIISAGITPKTCNNEHGYLNAVFNELSRASIIDYENPIKPLRQIKISEKELSFLSIDQINELLHSIDTGCENPHVAIITRICLATGARWGEAESLTLSKLHHGREHSPIQKAVKIDLCPFQWIYLKPLRHT